MLRASVSSFCCFFIIMIIKFISLDCEWRTNKKICVWCDCHSVLCLYMCEVHSVCSIVQKWVVLLLSLLLLLFNTNISSSTVCRQEGHKAMATCLWKTQFVFLTQKVEAVQRWRPACTWWRATEIDQPQVCSAPRCHQGNKSKIKYKSRISSQGSIPRRD